MQLPTGGRAGNSARRCEPDGLVALQWSIRNPLALSPYLPGASVGNVLRDTRGQAAVEALAVVPALLVAGLVAWQLVLAGHAAWLAAGAARVAARADLVGEDPRRAAESALPDALEHGLEVERSDAGVTRVQLAVPTVHRAWRGVASASAATSLEVSR